MKETLGSFQNINITIIWKVLFYEFVYVHTIYMKFIKKIREIKCKRF